MFERLAIAGKAAYDYVDKLDEELETGIRTIRRSDVSLQKPPAEFVLTTVSDYDLESATTEISSRSVFSSMADETVAGTYCRDDEVNLGSRSPV